MIILPPYNLPVVTAGSEEDLQMCKFLTTEGIVQEVSPNLFMLSSFLIHNRDC